MATDNQRDAAPTQEPTSPQDPVRSETDAGVATIKLNMPERKNALSPQLVETLGDALVAAMADDAVRAVVLTNTGNTFCAGADLKAATPGVSGTASEQPRHTFIDIFRLIMDGPKPVIGRADGHATGGGVGLIAACDISVMRDDAKIGFTEARLGVAPAVISVVCLPKMRRADASELFLTAERFTPARAAAVGLINAAVPASELDAMVEEYLNKIVRGGPMALAACKQLLTKVPEMDAADAFAWTSTYSAELFQAPEAKAGIAAFNARNDAPWIPAERR